MLKKLFNKLIFTIVIILLLSSCRTKVFYDNKKTNNTSEDLGEISEVLHNHNDKYNELKEEILDDIINDDLIISPTDLILSNKYDLKEYRNIVIGKRMKNWSIVRPPFVLEDKKFSKATIIYNKLIEKYNLILQSVYEDLNKNLNKNVFVKYTDFDGNDVNSLDIIKQVMSMANVYCFYHNAFSEEEYENYCNNLLEKAFTINRTESDIYYCSGCEDKDGKLYKIIENQDMPNGLDANDLKSRNIATESIIKFDLSKEDFHFGNFNIEDMNLMEANGKMDKTFYSNDELKNYVPNKFFDMCKGHQNIYINVIMHDDDDATNLYMLDDIGNYENNFNEYWNGWDEYKIEEKNILYDKNWEEEYLLTFPKIIKRDILTQEEINEYLKKLPLDISNDRFKIIKTALESVGKIPYYWGGKAYNPGYEKNYFYQIRTPDDAGRIYRGLDCAGWINWVIWTALGEDIKKEGTINLQNYGSRIRRSELRPGDLIVRPSYDSHVVMFLAWAEDGKMLVIHENATHGNVSVDAIDAYYTYYQKIPF